MLLALDTERIVRARPDFWLSELVDESAATWSVRVRHGAERFRAYRIGYPMNRKSRPMHMIPSAPKLTIPLFVKMSQSRLSFSPGSGLCRASSASTSSGNSNNPADGWMLNFSETVCVFRSSSLPARDGALESSNGEAKGPLAEKSDSQLVRLEDMTEGERNGDSSLNGFILLFCGGSSMSPDSARPTLE